MNSCLSIRFLHSSMWVPRDPNLLFFGCPLGALISSNIIGTFVCSWRTANNFSRFHEEWKWTQNYWKTSRTIKPEKKLASRSQAFPPRSVKLFMVSASLFESTSWIVCELEICSDNYCSALFSLVKLGIGSMLFCLDQLYSNKYTH